MFARAGHTVTLYDIDAGALAGARDAIKAGLAKQHALGLIDEQPDVVLARVSVTNSLEEAMRGADLVQENVRETVDAKKEIYARLDKLAGPDTLLASSTSGIPASSFTAELAGRHRCFVGHPINPPSVVPLVELVPAPWTDPAVIDGPARSTNAQARCRSSCSARFKASSSTACRVPLLAEAFRLVEDGYVNSGDIDKAVKDGLGLRWSFMGPMENHRLNAPWRHSRLLRPLRPALPGHRETSHAAREWNDALIGRLVQERLAELPADQRPARQAWRDQRLMSLVAHKRDASND